MNPRFRHSYDVRFDEGNRDGLLTPAAALRYMQDIAGLDSEHARIVETGAWVAKRTVIAFARPIPARAHLDFETFAIGMTRITAQRAYEASIAGERAITAHTLWVYLGDNGKPARIPEAAHAYWMSAGAQPQIKDPSFPPPPSALPTVAAYRVRFSDIDVYGHMNNAAYVAALDDAGWVALPDARENTLSPQHYDIEYMESALYGDELEIRTWWQSGETGERERTQQIWRGDTLIVRALSRWTAAFTLRTL